MFELLEMGKTRILADCKSEKHSFVPIRTTDTECYAAEPDGVLIPQIEGQNKCDFLVYCKNSPQTCFFELKGANISTKTGYNPYDQIIGTINYLKRIENLKEIVNPSTEKHAFIVSPGRQKIPSGVETKERQLWQALFHSSCLPKSIRPKISDLIHYVKVTSSERYSNKNGHIICSSKSPVELPFNPT